MRLKDWPVIRRGEGGRTNYPRSGENYSARLLLLSSLEREKQRVPIRRASILNSAIIPDTPSPFPHRLPARTIIKALLGDGWEEGRGDSSHTRIHTRTPSNLKLNAPEFELRPNLAKLGIVPLAKFWRGIRLVGSGLKSSRWWDEEI